MQTQTLNRITETVGATSRSQKQNAIFQLAEACSNKHPVRVAFPVRRREACLTRRAMLAALREAELAEWMNSGGDFLDSMHQPVS
jgi:hypothetical protein